MTYQDLADFIDHGMRMSHIYQPVMLIELLESGGKLSDEAIARKLLAHDQSQIEYYTRTTNNMVGRVLRNRGIVERDRTTKEYSLKDFESLDETQIKDLVARCQTRLKAYIASRGSGIYQHRRQSSGYISGTLRYDIFKRAKFRCELCGISADDKALEVDHIVPRNHDGSDDPSNLQALCYSCNAMKRDRDDTDFRAVRAAYSIRDEDCLFCQITPDSIAEENELAFVFIDGFPVTKGHRLIIPKRHTKDYFELGQAEINACQQLLHSQKALIDENDKTVTGFNIGVNIGKDSGQTVTHCHIHLIPRRAGDTDDPIGGVRNVIVGAGNYTKSDQSHQ
ncbi:HIT domain-containing protein [Akkermansiaceae bacterium]|nr:HIT domain-containing protein [Akkermansiaceae bacterium]MDA7611640.1 HIT domain-containing protein [bacterium]MDA7518680.1 HIT domain-containing protein [Akkermansiaceae bacterium]MDA7650944.1 HIT domain-containing protein [Akkermansiaceae bacterium]MDA7674942.1 HIT domain-containing protein [Akkermansiaceae bacterium]